MKPWIFLLTGIILVNGATAMQAERYLTVEEARKICFPKADQFQMEVYRFDANQKEAVEERSRVKVRNRGNRAYLALDGSKYLGVLILDQVIGKHELIDYAVAIDPSGQVRQVEILVYREHYGDEIRRPEWRAQFEGKTAGAPLELTGDISNISGATLSCKHVTQGIKRVLATYELVVRPELVVAGRLDHAVATRRP